MAFQVFAVTLATNSDNKGDATGAFIPGAQRIANAYGGSFRTFNNIGSDVEVKRNFLRTIEDGPGSLDLFAYFGHGWNTQLASAKIYTKSDRQDLANVLKVKLKENAIVVLYACLAGVEDGFSTQLQADLGQKIWVYGHTTVGHAYTNPDVSEVQQVRCPRFRKLFAGSDLMGAWQVALSYTDMWLRFPIMWDEFIIRELNAIRLLGTWIVSGNRKYVFEWSKPDGRYASLSDLNVNPAGTIREENTPRSGKWTIDDVVRISWNTGETESWALPVNPKSQPILGGTSSAKRLTHTKPGKLQG